MIQHYDSISYDTLEELNATYKSDHRKGVEPRFELSCYKVKKEGK